jgi:hypothetical protein
MDAGNRADGHRPREAQTLPLRAERDAFRGTCAKSRSRRRSERRCRSSGARQGCASSGAQRPVRAWGRSSSAFPGASSHPMASESHARNETVTSVRVSRRAGEPRIARYQEISSRSSPRDGSFLEPSASEMGNDRTP